MQYANMRNTYNNQEKVIFPGMGRYEVPAIPPIDISLEGLGLVRIDKALKCKDPENKIIHFFTNDYVFEKVWRMPDRYTALFARFKGIIAPDFSLYTDHPKACQIFNHFRKQWLGAYYASLGINVIPCVRWLEGDKKGFDWCLDGIPSGSTICVSTLGGIKGQWRKDDFSYSLQTALNILSPSRLIIVGDFFPGLYDLDFDGQVEHVENEALEEIRGGGKVGMGRSSSRGGGRDNTNWEDNPPERYKTLSEKNVDTAMVNAKWEKELTDTEKRAIERYTSVDGVAEDINGNLRRGRRPGTDIEALESALDKGYLKQNTIFHRVGDSTLLGEARTVSEIKAMYGQVVHDKGFGSTSATPNSSKYPGKQDRIAYHIKTPQGRGIGAYVKNHSDYGWENEFLFNRGSVYKVEGAWKDIDGLVHVNLAYAGRA